ncbi:MAG: molybdopterin-guanine dinucleotide biosynthesis protein B [Pseudomonadota bacterium]
MKAVFGVTGWKNAGKTTLVSRLVATFSARGYAVSTVKHAHEGYEMDREGSDTHQHAAAGAQEIAIAGGPRWALLHEGSGDNATLPDMVARLSPCDLVLVEGFKGEPHPKIECRRESSVSQQPIWQRNPTIVAVASSGVDEPCPVPEFDLDDVETIADFITDHLGLASGLGSRSGTGIGSGNGAA